MLHKLIAGCIVFFGLVATSFGGEASVSKSVEVNASFERVVASVKYCQDDLFDALNIVVLERKDNIVKLKAYNVVKTHYMTVKLTDSIDKAGKKATFKCEMIESDGFVTKSLSQLEIVENNGKVTVTATFSATVPEVRSPLVKNDQVKAMNKLLAKVESLLIPNRTFNGASKFPRL